MKITILNKKTPIQLLNQGNKSIQAVDIIFSKTAF